MATPNPSQGDIVSFQLVVNSVNGDERVDVKVDGLVNFNTARMVDQQIVLKHKNLYPYFKDKVNNVDDPQMYKYLVVMGRNGQLEAVGIPWINDSTFKLIDGRNEVLGITNWQEDFRAPLVTFLQDLGATYTLNVQDK